MKTIQIFLAVFLLGSLANAAQRRFDGFQVFEVKPKDRASFDALVQLQLEGIQYDFWTEPRSLDRPVDIMVPPASIKDFINFLDAFGMEYRLKISDVQSVIEESKRDIASPQKHSIRNRVDGSPRYSLNWTSYSDYPAIEEFIKEIAANYPEFVTLINIATTFERNDIYVVKISNPRTASTTKKNIFADAGIHAREWIAPAFATWLILELVENYADHPQYVDNIDWYIIPVLNPDGYRYTFSGDRLWRKNRTPTNGTCIGTDLNRNYDFHWDEGGSSSVTCSDIYHGGAPFNQIESKAAADFVKNTIIGDRTPVYLAFHSYGQYFLTPWGYTADYPEDYDQLYELASRAGDKLTAVYGTKYTIGTSTNALSPSSGCSDDWAKGAGQMPYSYTFEMRDQGLFGFQLPANQIIPNNLEVWEAVKVIAEEFF